MRVNEDLIKHVAELARINLTKDEITEFTPQLKEVLEHFEKIQQVDTEDIEPSFQPIRMRDALREDKIEPSIPQEEALRNAQHKKDGFFRGPGSI